MGSCTGRHFLLIICVFQLIVVLECQIFDFMGFMYGPILANFFHIIFIILGFFGTFQYSPKYIISYAVFNIFWIGWTSFVICFYLDVGVLDKNSDILNLGTGSRSWWEIHGYGCIADFTTGGINGTSIEQDPDPFRPPKPIKVEGCLLEYQYVEVIQSSVQCILSILGVSGGFHVCRTYMEEDDSLLFLWNTSRSPQQVELQPVYVNYRSNNRSSGKREWQRRCYKNRVRFSDKTDPSNPHRKKDLTPLIDSKVSYVRFDPSDTYATVDEYINKSKTHVTTVV